MYHRRAVVLLVFLALAALWPELEEATQDVSRSPPTASCCESNGRPRRVHRRVHEDTGLGLRTSRRRANAMAAVHGGKVLLTYGHALKGYWAKMTEAQAQALAADPRVAYVQENGFISINAAQTGATWGLDRRTSGTCCSTPRMSTTRGARAFTPTSLKPASSRRTRSSRAGSAMAMTVTPGGNATDCNGHGTHVAATVGGTTYGRRRT